MRGDIPSGGPAQKFHGEARRSLRTAPCGKPADQGTGKTEKAGAYYLGTDEVEAAAHGARTELAGCVRVVE